MADNPLIITNVTYAELVALIGSSGLKPGLYYRITDFATRHFLTDGLSAQALVDGVPAEVTGTTETLIVHATSLNTIDKRVCSVEYPNDIIEYDWNPANWLDNINFAVEGTIISDFKGVITYREDTIQNNSAGFDFRNALNRLWSVDQTEWSADPGTYEAGSYVKVTGETTIIYISLDACIGTDVPGESPLWRALWDITDTPYYWASNSSSMTIDGDTTIPVTDASDFIDIKSFGNAYETVTNLHLPKKINSNDWWEFGEGSYKILIPTIVIHSKEGTMTTDGSFGDDCVLGVLGNNNYGFSLGNGNGGFSLGNNNYGFSLGNGNGSFSLGNNNGSFSLGIGNGSFSLGNNNGNFSLGNGNYGFTNPTLVNVTIGDGIDFAGIDFADAYYISQEYSKTIIKDSAGNIKLWYIDETGTMQVKDVNATEPI